jgi:DNA-binding SARP family transcriptional activator
VIELGILGPLVLRLNDEEVGLGPSLRVLVLALLCARGVPVPVARLGVLLAQPGATPIAEATVRSHVSHLRRVIGDGHSRGKGPKVLVSARVGGAVAYAMRHEAIDTDAARFDVEVGEGESGLRKADYALAGVVLAGALSRWRGAPLADADGRPYARDWAAHLQDQRRHAVVLRAAARIGAAEHATVSGELERMVARWPDDEIVRALHAIALYRAGRPAKAAAACRDAIRAAQSHGLDSPRLHALQRDVLNGTLPEFGLPHTPWEVDFVPLRPSTGLPLALHNFPRRFHALIGRLERFGCPSGRLPWLVLVSLAGGACCPGCVVRFGACWRRAWARC